jgi:hypothetical protein
MNLARRLLLQTQIRRRHEMVSFSTESDLGQNLGQKQMRLGD